VNRARVLLVAKRSAYSHHLEQKQDARAAELIERGDPTVQSWRDAHEEHQATLEQTKGILKKLGAKVTLRMGSRIPFDTSDTDLVVTVGGDGTLLRASRNVRSVPVLGINSSPRFSVGFFCAAHGENLEPTLEAALKGTVERVVLTRMRVRVNDTIVSQRVLNEALFSHTSPAATSRYILEVSARVEEQRSSGIWIGPAAGSTGALHSAGGTILPLESRQLQLVVREAYTPAGQRYELLKVILEEQEEVLVRSKMRDASLFLDGPYQQAQVRLGDVVTFSASDEPLTLLGFSKRRFVPKPAL
jgi:NAD+ kinase